MEMTFDKLSNLCDIQIGKTPSRKVAKYWGKGYPWVAISDLKKRYICKTKEQITSEAVIEAGCKLIPKDTLLMSFKLSIGKLAFTTCDLYTNEAIVALSVKNKNEIDNNYLYYALQNIPLLGGAKVAVKGNTLNKKSLGKLKIPLQKNIDDQIKIANLLSQVEALIAKREESINLLDALLRSTFLDMFGDPVLNGKGWDEKPFNYFAKIDTNMTTEFDKYKDYPHIGVGNIERDTGKILEYKSIKDENIISGKYIFTPEHIIYSKIRPNLNKVALPTFNGLASADSYPILVNKDVTNKYFFAYVLRSDAFIRFILNFSLRANIPKVNKKQLEKFSCINPPKPLQDKFATIVQQVEESKKKYQESLNELQQLFGSLSQRAFKGELNLDKMKNPVAVKISDATFLDAPSSSGEGDIVIEHQKVEHIKDRAKSGAGDLEEVLGIPTFTRKQIEDMTGATQIAEAIKQESLKPIVKQVEALKKSLNLGETMKQISSSAKLFKSLNIPSFKIDIPPLNVQIPHIDTESFKIFQTSQQLMESMQKRKEHVLQMLEDIPQIKQAIEEDVLCKDDFLDVTLRFDYEYAEIKRIIMDKLASNEIVQYFDEEKKRIKLGKAT